MPQPVGDSWAPPVAVRRADRTARRIRVAGASLDSLPALLLLSVVKQGQHSLQHSRLRVAGRGGEWGGCSANQAKVKQRAA
jgi:hypothetical protein